MPRLPHPQSVARLFAIPALLSVSAITGLVAGLVGEGAWDVATWLLLGLLPLTMVVSWSRRG